MIKIKNFNESRESLVNKIKAGMELRSKMAELNGTDIDEMYTYPALQVESALTVKDETHIERVVSKSLIDRVLTKELKNMIDKDITYFDICDWNRNIYRIKNNLKEEIEKKGEGLKIEFLLDISEVVEDAILGDNDRIDAIDVFENLDDICLKIREKIIHDAEKKVTDILENHLVSQSEVDDFYR